MDRNLTTEEMLRLICGGDMMSSVDMSDKGILPIRMSDGPIGLRYQKVDKDSMGINPSEPATELLSGPALAATWNADVAKKIGNIIGSEAAYYDIDLVLGPGVNLARNPLCGRNGEYYSEDPLLAGKIAAGYIKGVKEQGVDCCIKHFAANNQETEREYLNVKCDEATLRELYLKVFEIAIKEGLPAAVMTSLSRINGVFCSDNKWLLTKVLREEWGFDGIVMTDWLGIDDRATAIEAGLDLEMPGTDGANVEIERRALAKGTLSLADVRRNVERIIRTSEKLHQHSKEELPEDLFYQNHQTVIEACDEAIVLLKNENQILPLQTGTRVAVIGAYAEKPLMEIMGSGRVSAIYQENAVKQIKDRNGDTCTTYVPGYAKENAADEAERQQMLQDAVEAARHAEVVLVFLATDSWLEGEGRDRKIYDLPAYQTDVLSAVADVNSHVVAVVMNGGAVPMPWADRTDGILECFNGGQGVGASVAKILFGEINPSGHMPVSVPKKLEHIISWENFGRDTEEVTYHEGIFMGYRGYCTKGVEVQWPFGHGLSYTDFTLEEMTLDKESMTDADQLTVRVRIRNNGSRTGSQVAQLYVQNAPAWKARPILELRGFEKVKLEPQEEKELTFVLDKEAFWCFDERIGEYSTPAGLYQICAGFSVEDIRQRADIQMAPQFPVPDRVVGWSKAGRLLETEEGREIFENLLALIRSNASERFRAEESELRSRLLESPLRLVHLMLWSVLTESEFIAILDRFNASLYEKYKTDRAKVLLEEIEG